MGDKIKTFCSSRDVSKIAGVWKQSSFWFKCLLENMILNYCKYVGAPMMCADKLAKN